MKTTDAVITEILEAMGGQMGQWIRISELESAGTQELTEALQELVTEEGFQAEPETHRHRLTQADRDAAVIIGGEPRHLIKWEM